MAVLKEAELGAPVAELIRKVGVSEQTFYRWKMVYGGLEPGQTRRLKQLEEENAKLKRLVADLSLDKIMLQDVPKKVVRPSRRRDMIRYWCTLERFHQTLKTEEVYWKHYASPAEARESLEIFRRRLQLRARRRRRRCAVELILSGDDLGSSRVASRGTIHVKGTTMRALIQEFGLPHFIKSDIEGADRWCVLGLDESTRPQYLSFEAGLTEME